MDTSKSRVTITVPSSLLQEIDRQVKNRSRFILEAIERELERRRHELLRASLSEPHPETADIAEAGLGPRADLGLLDPSDDPVLHHIRFDFESMLEISAFVVSRRVVIVESRKRSARRRRGERECRCRVYENGFLACPRSS